MQRFSILVKGSALFLFALAAMASPAAARGARYFHSKDEQGNRVVLYATEHRVLSGTFIAAGPRTLKCSDKSVVLTGGFPIKSTKMTSGRFHTVAKGYMGEGGSWRLAFRGTLRHDAIRGSLVFHFINRSPEGSFECWSGQGQKNPLVSYVANAGR